ncbi:hypothetical protein [Halorubrum sp. CBA1229]|jgi:hypothetical protein|uniref:hypothetical protein n=1 Tax=Halorubrum sp. CBA1229 TaxID=1853699 RepID=UPI0015932109|nr:hypothetical protein [Halorubrum sp. CBA1229]QKY17869.1 hypothetical protein Hrr1229_013605 [Halorubrum sp. CBA1229]
MSASTQTRPRYATPTRKDVTDCRTDRIADLVRTNRVRGSEVALERRGGRTYLVTRPAE